MRVLLPGGEREIPVGLHRGLRAGGEYVKFAGASGLPSLSCCWLNASPKRVPAISKSSKTTAAAAAHSHALVSFDGVVA